MVILSFIFGVAGQALEPILLSASPPAGLCLWDSPLSAALEHWAELFLQRQ